MNNFNQSLQINKGVYLMMHCYERGVLDHGHDGRRVHDRRVHDGRCVHDGRVHDGGWVDHRAVGHGVDGGHHTVRYHWVSWDYGRDDSSVRDRDESE